MILNKLKKTYLFSFFKCFNIFIFLFFIFLISKSLLQYLNIKYITTESDIIIIGNYNIIPKNEIIKLILKNSKKENFLSKSLIFIKNKIKELPLIQKISIRKKWPKKIFVNLVQFVPLAFFNNFLIDKNANLLNNNYSSIHKIRLPIIIGPEGEEKKHLKKYFFLIKKLKEINIKILILLIKDNKSLKILTQDNILLKLGYKHHNIRLNNLINVYPLLLKDMNKNKKKIKYIDLRYINGLAVKWT